MVEDFCVFCIKWYDSHVRIEEFFLVDHLTRIFWR